MKLDIYNKTKVRGISKVGHGKDFVIKSLLSVALDIVKKKNFDPNAKYAIGIVIKRVV